MNIASSADNGYLPHFAAMMHSAWIHNRSANFYLLDAGISKENVALLEKFAQEQAIHLTVLPVKKRLETIGGYVNHPTYARLLIPQLIDADRVLYMDGDTTILGDLSELYSTNLNGFAFAVRTDDSEISYVFESEATGAPFTYEHYFNSGVMVIDVPRWRDEKISERAIKFAVDFAKKLPLADQTALNYITLDKYQKLGSQWNCFRVTEMVEQPAPVVLHYIFDKVWTRGDSPFQELYQFHRNKTPWPIHEFPKPTYSRNRRLKYKLGAMFGNERMRYRLQYFNTEKQVEETIVRPAVERATALSALKMT